MRIKYLGALLLSASLWAGPTAAQDINTIVGPSSNSVLNAGTDASWGDAWVGQTFTVPAAQTFLSSVAFQVGYLTLPTNVFASIVIKRWSGGLSGSPSGSPILDVAIPTPTKVWSDTTSQLSIDVGKYLTPGGIYVAYIKATTQPNTPGDTWQMQLWSTNYSGGFVVAKYDSVASWFTLGSHDAGFKADFAPIPEPATVVLLGTGLIGMVGWGVRRRRNL